MLLLARSEMVIATSRRHTRVDAANSRDIGNESYRLIPPLSHLLTLCILTVFLASYSYSNVSHILFSHRTRKLTSLVKFCKSCMIIWVTFHAPFEVTVLILLSHLKPWGEPFIIPDPIVEFGRFFSICQCKRVNRSAIS